MKNFYRSDDDEEAHFKKFERNLNKIENHNEKFGSKKTKFQLGVWDFSDFDEQEFRTSGLNGYKGRPRKRGYPADFDWDDIPENLDYTALGFVTDVQFQGLCGSCWYFFYSYFIFHFTYFQFFRSFATVGAIEGQLRKVTGVLIKLSEQSLIDCNRDPNEGSKIAIFTNF